MKYRLIVHTSILLISTTLGLLGQAKSSGAATYYVDCLGNDNNNGTSTATPWQTLSKATSITLTAGDQILLKRGCTFAESVYLSSIAGSEAADITFGSYGMGELPIIDATGQGAGITVASSSHLTFKDLEIRNAQGNGMQFIFGNDYITINNLKSNNNGVNGLVFAEYNQTFSGSITNNFITIKNSTISYNAGAGFAIAGLRNSLVQSNTLTHNCQSMTCGNNCDYCGGMYATDDSDTVYEYNLSSFNGQGRSDLGGAGLWLDVNGTNQTLRYNLAHHNNGPGLYNETTSNSKIYGNVSYDNGTGIWLEGRIGDPPWNYPAVNNYIINNTAYHNRDFGILIQCAGMSGATHDNFIINNIAFGTTAGPNLRVGGGAESEPNTINHNSFGTASPNMFEIGWGRFKSTYADLDSWYGQPTNSIQSDPFFVNSSDGHLSLRASSPGIDFGANLGAPYNQALSAISAWPLSVILITRDLSWDIGAYEYQSGGDTSPPAAPNGLVVH